MSAIAQSFMPRGVQDHRDDVVVPNAEEVAQGVAFCGDVEVVAVDDGSVFSAAVPAYDNAEAVAAVGDGPPIQHHQAQLAGFRSYLG